LGLRRCRSLKGQGYCGRKGSCPKMGRNLDSWH
jgi:hypothetical protein